MIFDPFCGSGTSIVSAQRHQRRWIGCDSSKDAIDITVQRLGREFGETERIFRMLNSADVSGMPVIPTEFKRIAIDVDDLTSGAGFEFVLNQQVPIEETRHFEFKEIRSSTGAVDSIVNTSDEYAVAFLNSEGGRLFWGIRDKDRVVVGVRLNDRERDKVRRDVSSKLNQIEPRVDPSRYRIEIHKVRDEQGRHPIPDLCIVEMIVPAPQSAGPFYTGGGDAWVKIDGGKQKLKGVALTDFIKQRLSKNGASEGQ